MARTRERQPCRRGRGRGASSSRSAGAGIHHCCCCNCHRRATATPLPAQQLVEVGSAGEGAARLPAFGSVVFSLGSPDGHQGINAHITIMFTQAAEDEVGAVVPPGSGGAEVASGSGGAEVASEAQVEQGAGGKGKAVVPPGSGGAEVASGSGGAEVASEAQVEQGAGGKGKAPMDVYKPSLGPAPLGFTEESWRARWEGVEEGHGWARIVEEQGPCEEAEQQLASLQPPSAHPQK
jgi:hypothetical protein